MPREFFEHASTSYLIGWIGSRNIDKHMPFRQYAVSNAYSCCPPWPFWSRLSIWIYQPLTESCPETIMIWWNNEQILPFHQSNTAYLLIKILSNASKFFIQLILMNDCYIFSPCTLKTCDFKWLDWLDRWSQYWQAYAFSPVCTLKCLLMFFVRTILKQIEHLDLPTSNGKLSWNNHDLMEKLKSITISSV